ncbi:MAG: rRNA maturation RNase YbeY [Bryobacterales bacterium]|nr:rRNA maturation RNase YbeY [Bryobacterales bacterium]
MPSQERLLLYRRAPASLNRPALLEFAKRLCQEVAEGRRFTCLVTGDRELRRLNLQFLGNDCPTDVLSFPSGEPGGDLGEIAISADRAAAQACQFSHPVEQEIAILMLHGLLHLLGMDHARDRGRMARAEAGWRKTLGLGAGLIERVRR